MNRSPSPVIVPGRHDRRKRIVAVLVALALGLPGTALSILANATPIPAPSGTVISWGYDRFGELTILVRLTGVTAICAGTVHSLAIKEVVVADTTPPVLTLPSSMSVEATSSAGTAVTFEATATDNIDPNPAVSCSPASAATFALGVTPVTCTATDAAGITASGDFTVTVLDTTPPVVVTVPADATATATSTSGAVVTYARLTQWTSSQG